MWISRETFSKTWVIGGLAYCSFEDFKKALKEILFKLGFSLIPMFLAAIILRLSDSRKTLIFSFLDSFSQGQLFLFSTSMLSTILYLAIREEDNISLGFPNKKSHIAIVSGMFGFSTIVYIMNRLSMKIDLANLIDISYVFFIIALLMVLLALTIGNGLKNNPTRFVKKQTKDFVDGYEHRG